MSEEDTKRLMSILEDADKFSETIGKVLNAAKILGAIVVACLLAFASTVIWVNAKATTIDELKAWTVRADTERKETLKDWTAWRSEQERLMAAVIANQTRVIAVQDQQAKLFAEHLNASISRKDYGLAP